MTKAGEVTINEISSSQVVATGETLHHHLNIMGVGHQPMVIEHPIIWLKTPKGLSISNIRLTNNTGQSITTKDGLIVSYNQQLDNSDYRYTKIDTSYCKAYQVQLDVKTIGESIINAGLILDWDIKTTANSPIGTYYYKDMIYIDSPGSDSLRYYNSTNGRNITSPTNIIPGVTRDLVGIGLNLADRYFQIKEAQGLTVSTAAKSVAAEEYAPVTVNHPILVNNTTDGASNIKVDVRNNTDAQLDTPQVIYVPIPKQGEKWGNNPAFQFSMTLTQAVQAAAGLGGTVEYGVGVTPKTIASELAAQASKFSANVSDLSTVNCLYQPLSSQISRCF